ncbi:MULTISPECIES: hypothetical protein [unclassified Nocardia]|uniref:hypothetical protein n=1 Tax=unclassified Nocardia TaxID=2637762 RepID=UPI001CE45952|nr:MULTISPECIES: hypothetical protein [unclassified Nocardia]
MVHRESGLHPDRPGREIIDGGGYRSWAIWDDDRATYTLQWNAVADRHCWQMAVWARTAIEAVEAIRTNDAALTESEFVGDALREVAALHNALKAIQDELLRASRTARPRVNQEAAEAAREALYRLVPRHDPSPDDIAPIARDWSHWLTGPADNDPPSGRPRFVPFSR